MSSQEKKADSTPLKDHGLHPTTPNEIISFVAQHLDSALSIEIAPPGGVVSVPKEWHGAGKSGEAMVTFGEVLITPISETVVSAETFTHWLTAEGFVLEVQGQLASPSEAASALESSTTVIRAGENPVFRAVREKQTEKKPPIMIEIFSGALSQFTLNLSSIGNKNLKEVSNAEKSAYKGAVANLMLPFVAKGLSKAKERLQISPTIKRLRRVDDCLASMTTILGDMLIDEKLGIPTTNLLEELSIAVATTQGMSLAIMMADRRNVPLIIRGGSISFGLAGKEKGLNYMVNTLPEALAQGYFTTGDLGELMKEQNPILDSPRVLEEGRPTGLETRFFLTGGSPMFAMLKDAYKEREKPYHGVVSVRRASRVNALDYKNWGVIISGLDRRSAAL